MLGQFDAIVAAAVGVAEPGPARKQAARVLYRWRRAVLAQRPVPVVEAGPEVPSGTWPDDGAHDRDRAAAAAASEWGVCWGKALEERERAARMVSRLAAEEAKRATAGLLATARDERFRAAVATSNPGLYEQALTATSVGHDDAAPRRVRTLYAYLQRLCAKNESTSFFGPVEYGTWNAATRPVSGPSVQCTLAYWAVAAIAERVADDPALRATVHHELKPSLTLTDDGRVLVLAGGDRRRLSAAAAAQLRYVLAGGSVERLPPGFRRVLVSELEPPTAVDDPARWLLDRLSAVAARAGDSVAAEAAHKWIGALQDLARLAQDFGDHVDDQRYHRLLSLERGFSALVGIPARQRSGDSYADRLCFTEKRRNDREVHGVSADASREIVAELQPLLDLCYAYCARVQSAITAVALREHTAMCRDSGLRLLRCQPLRYVSMPQ